MLDLEVRQLLEDAWTIISGEPFESIVGGEWPLTDFAWRVFMHLAAASPWRPPTKRARSNRYVHIDTGRTALEVREPMQAMLSHAASSSQEASKASKASAASAASGASEGSEATGVSEVSEASEASEAGEAGEANEVNEWQEVLSSEAAAAVLLVSSSSWLRTRSAKVQHRILKLNYLDTGTPSVGRGNYLRTRFASCAQPARRPLQGGLGFRGGTA
mmetsp:Transcript_11599/g.27258  ORF Transcript_11599/g.27258 Transcript_11599/m.27258 type:complete len:217 (-) Transcript_11599:287-937(-)